jgi:3-hydroxybutyrate dehydrogenase
MQKVAITGGTGGLGTAVVERLSRTYDVVVLDRTRLDDVTNEASVTKAFAELGEHYALVHLVGGWTGGKVVETSFETWERMLAINLTGAFLTIRESLKHLTRPGRIVVISSTASLRPFTPGSAAYTVAKSALNTLIETVAAEYRGTGITANAILPNAMATPAMLRATKDTSKLVPVENVAELIAYFLKESSGSVTGHLTPLRK